MVTPTLTQLTDCYLEAAAIEQLKTGKPSRLTIRNTLSGIRHYREWLRNSGEVTSDEDSLSQLTPKTLRSYLSSMILSGIRPISALSFVMQLRQLFAKWALVYYEDRGLSVPVFPALRCPVVVPRYRRPAPELLRRVKEWYHSLSCDMLWYVTTMMLEFAMRNGDVRRLARVNFVESSGRVFLNYTPHKTARSSGRMVRWPVHPTIWEGISRLRPWECPPNDGHFDRINAKMRELGFRGSKGAYELRKICIDHVYQKFGAEMAVSISGDDIRTITRYYADPAQPNLGDIRVSELL